MTTTCLKCKCEKSCPQQLCSTCRNTIAQNREKKTYVEKEYQSHRWAHRVCVHSKLTDKKKNRSFNQNNYITPNRLKQIREIQDNKCIYCNTELQTYNRKRPNGLTIERLDNNLAHITSNCVICCFHCNVRSSYKTFTTPPSTEMMKLLFTS